MFALLRGLYQWLIESVELKLLILGIDNAGKTTTLEMLRKLKRGKGTVPDAIPPTIGLNIGRVRIDNVDAVIWDLGGQVALRGIWERYYTECTGMLFVVDSTDGARLVEAKECLHGVLHSPSMNGRRLPVVIFANKQDVEEHAVTTCEIAEALQLDGIRCTSLDILQSSGGCRCDSQADDPEQSDDVSVRGEDYRAVEILGGSAKLGINVLEAVTLLVQLAKNERKRLEDESRSTDSRRL